MSTPLYRQVAATIRERIEDGTYPPGSVIPTERELAESLDVARSVVRQAVAELRADGLVESVRKRGTTVRPRSVRLSLSRYAATIQPGGKLGPWETACAAQGVDGRTELVSVEVTEAPDGVAHALGVEPGSPVVTRRRHMWIADQIAQIQTAYVPHSLAQGTPLESDGKIVGGIYGAMTALGHRPHAVTETIGARTLTDDEAALMKRPRTTPALTITRITYDDAGQALEVLHATALADAAQLVYERLPINA